MKQISDIETIEYPEDINKMNLNVDIFALEFWENFFYPGCDLDFVVNYTTDKVRLVSVISKPPEPIPNSHPILMIPGWFSLIYGWKNVVKVISKSLTVVYFDSREKVTSSLPDKSVELSVERYAKDLEEVRDKLGIDFQDSIAVGSSMGGSLLFQYLAHNRKVPSKVVLIGPNPKIPIPPIIGTFILSLPLFVVNLTKKYVKWHLNTFLVDGKKEPEQKEKYEGVLDASNSWRVRQSARDVRSFNAWPILNQIQAEVIMIGAVTDKMHTAERTKEIGKKIPNAKYYEFNSNKATHSNEMGEFLVKLAKEEKIDGLRPILEN